MDNLPWANYGLVGLLSGGVLGICLYLLKITIPAMAETFREELKAEREAFQVELKAERDQCHRDHTRLLNAVARVFEEVKALRSEQAGEPDGG